MLNWVTRTAVKGPRRYDGRPASVPPGIRVYAFGDVHGRADLLEQKFKAVDHDKATRPAQRIFEVLLGDYVDRGSRSREVLELIIKRRESGELLALAGNHESMFLGFLNGRLTLDQWRPVGGAETLTSYHLRVPAPKEIFDSAELLARARNMIPKEHVAFLSSLGSSFACGDFFFTHAGVKPGIPLSNQDVSDLLWIREEFLQHKGPFGKVIVHGHTPVAHVEVKPHRINLDTGAFFTGNLSCMAFEDATQRLI